MLRDGFEPGGWLGPEPEVARGGAPERLAVSDEDEPLMLGEEGCRGTYACPSRLESQFGMGSATWPSSLAVARRNTTLGGASFGSGGTAICPRLGDGLIGLEGDDILLGDTGGADVVVFVVVLAFVF